MFGNGCGELVCNQIKSFIPACAAVADLRREKTNLGPEGLAECRAFGTEPPKIRRVIGIAFDRHTVRADIRKNPTADTAIGAGGFDIHAAERSMTAASSIKRPFSTRIA